MPTLGTLSLRSSAVILLGGLGVISALFSALVAPPPDLVAPPPDLFAPPPVATSTLEASPPAFPARDSADVLLAVAAPAPGDSAPWHSVLEHWAMSGGPLPTTLKINGVPASVEQVSMPPDGLPGVLVRDQHGRLVGAYIPDPRYGGITDYDLLRQYQKTGCNSARDRLMHDRSPFGLAHMVALALAREAGAELAILNWSSLRGHLPAGPVSAELLNRALPFGDRILIVTLSGEEIREAIMSSQHAKTPLLAVDREGHFFTSNRLPGSRYRVAVPEYLLTDYAECPIIAGAGQVADSGFSIEEIVLRHLARTGGAP